jgi:hypothetical protein
LLMIGLAIVVLIGGAIMVSKLAQPTVDVVPFTARPIDAPTGITPEGYAYKGSPEASITVIEYGDFQCPSCAAFATHQEATFDQRYIETGNDRSSGGACGRRARQILADARSAVCSPAGVVDQQ